MEERSNRTIFHPELVKRKSTKVKNVTPKSYKGVAYKSSLEAYCAQALDKAGLPVNYESWKVVLRNKLQSKVECWEPKTKKQEGYPSKTRTFAPVSQNIRQSIYTPDFVCLEQGWVIETKGLRSEAFNLRWVLFKAWLADNGLEHFTLYMPGNQSEVDTVIRHIKSKQ